MTASRRPLGATLLDVACGAIDAIAQSPHLTLRSVSVKLPVEVGLRRVGGEWELVADVPRLVTRTAFDTAPSRLEVLWVPGEAA